MTRPRSWGWELESYRRRERRRRLLRAGLVVVGAILTVVAAIAVAVLIWFAMVGFLVIFS